MAEIKTVLTDEEINARLGVIAKATPAGFHLHPIVKFINGTISTTKKGTVKFPIEIGIDQLGSPFTDLRAVASPNSNELIPFLVFVEPSAIEAAVLSANAGKMDEWLPIESAPKDGTFILLGSKAGSWVARYQPVYQSGYRPENPWQSMMLNHAHMPLHDRSKPTHWKPLTGPSQTQQAIDAGKV